MNQLLETNNKAFYTKSMTKSMPDQKILLSFVGNRDPYVENDDDYGPVLSLLQAKQFSRIYLFCTGPDYLERARMVEEIAGSFWTASRFYFVNIDLDSPIDYEEIFSKLKTTVDQVTDKLAHKKTEYYVLLDPGTPQMQTAWFLLAKSGTLKALLLQGIPPRFAAGAYKVKEVNLDSRILPTVSLVESSAAVMAPPDLYKSIEETKWFSLRQGDLIIGNSPDFIQVVEQAKKVSSYEISVLIRGETGTGKGLLARYLHEQSSRRDQPFVAVNCATIGPSLAESELFGHVKGSFTGASRDRIGKFRSAEHGTVFLDEIGDLPLEIQPKLLHTLEAKTLVPVGADKELNVDIRILAATNQDLEKLIEKGKFRRDLYERLNQYTLQLPPLRRRKTDIPLLIKQFLNQWNNKYGENKQIAEEALSYLLEYSWPGNIRELQNSITAMCATALSGPISSELLPAPILAYFKKQRTTPSVPVALPEKGLNLKALLYQIEKEFYGEALKKADGNKEQAAGLLGINGPTFRKALRERFGEDAL